MGYRERGIIIQLLFVLISFSGCSLSQIPPLPAETISTILMMVENIELNQGPPTTSPTITPSATATPFTSEAVSETQTHFQLVADYYILPDDYTPGGSTHYKTKQKVILELTLGEEAVEVVHILDSNQDVAGHKQYAWTPNRNVSRLEADGQIWQIELPGKNRTVLVSPPVGERIIDYQWSDVGGLLAYRTASSETEPVEQTFWIKTKTGETKHIFTWEYFPAKRWTWIPNEEELAFLAGNLETGIYTIFTIDPKTQTQTIWLAEEILSSSIFSRFVNAISPDGQKLIYAKVDQTTDQTEIWLYDTAKKQELLILTGPYSAPEWTPQSTILLRKFIHRLGSELFEVEQNGKNLREVKDDRGSTALEGSLSWSPDGRWLAMTEQVPGTGYAQTLLLWDRSVIGSRAIEFPLPKNKAIDNIDW